jgi:hypothetical protein
VRPFHLPRWSPSGRVRVATVPLGGVGIDFKLNRTLAAHEPNFTYLQLGGRGRDTTNPHRAALPNLCRAIPSPAGEDGTHQATLLRPLQATRMPGTKKNQTRLVRVFLLAVYPGRYPVTSSIPSLKKSPMNRYGYTSTPNPAFPNFENPFELKAMLRVHRGFYQWHAASVRGREEIEDWKRRAAMGWIKAPEYSHDRVIWAEIEDMFSSILSAKGY